MASRKELQERAAERVIRNKKWAAKFGEQSPIRVNEIEPNTQIILALLAEMTLEDLREDANG